MIGLSKKDKDVWDKFALSVRQGATPQVKSDERRQAMIAVDDLVKRYQDSSVYFVHEAKIGSSVQLGSAGLSLEQKEQGYVATICSMLQGNSEDEQQPLAFQDLHVTRSQLEQLAESIRVFLKNHCG